MTNSSIRSRLSRLEGLASAHDPDRARIEEDARIVRERLEHMAAAFGQADSHPSQEKVATWSPAQHLAWAMRFRPSISAAASQ